MIERNIIQYKNIHQPDTKETNISTFVISEKKNIVILGDNMIKHDNGYDKSKRLENCKVYVKRFSGSKV